MVHPQSPAYTFLRRAYFGHTNPSDPPTVCPLAHSKFYILPKVHKTPWKTRPVISQSGCLLENLSKWLDSELQRVVHLCPSYFKDSWELLDLLKSLDTLPEDAYIFSADAVGMYSNIDTDLGLSTMKKWFELHRHELPPGFDPDAILRGLELVMRNNVFEFGNTLWLQLVGTAMGTSVACMYATIYFSYHEETGILLPTTFQGQGKLLLYKRFIDDAIIIFTATRRFLCHTLFLQKMNEFGEPGKRLVWEATNPGKSVDFMDLTITLQPDGRITTATYQKPMNLYLYLPPTSAHSPALQQSIIFSALKCMRIQNSLNVDFLRFTTLFYK
jgi:hypothetical protein